MCAFIHSVVVVVVSCVSANCSLKLSNVLLKRRGVVFFAKSIYNKIALLLCKAKFGTKRDKTICMDHFPQVRFPCAPSISKLRIAAVYIYKVCALYYGYTRVFQAYNLLCSPCQHSKHSEKRQRALP